LARKCRKIKNKEPEVRGPQPDVAPSRRVHEIFGILTLASALLLGPSLVSVQVSDGSLMGPFGQTLGGALNKILGISGYLVVVILIVVALRIFAWGLGVVSSPVSRLSQWRERIGLTLSLLFVSILLHLAVRPTRISGASAGGLVGEIGAELLCAVLSTPGAWIVSLAGLAMGLVLATAISWARAGLALLRLVWRGGLQARESLHHGSARLRHLAQALPELLRRQEVATASDGVASLPPVVRLDLARQLQELTSIDPPTRLPAEMPQDLEIDRARGGGASLEIERPAPESPELPALPQIPCLDLPQTPQARPVPAPEPRAVDNNDNIEIDEIDEIEIDETDVVDERVDPEPAAKPTPATEAESDALHIVEPQYHEDRAPIIEEAAKPVEQTDGPGFVLNGDVYNPPPLSLLEYEKKEDTSIDRDAIYRQADKLVKTLSDYKILGRVTEVHPGPVVTMYEFKPAPGTRISKVANLANDLAMSLSAMRVRIVAPIPGKGTIGIEVPNEHRDTVYFKEIVAHDAFRKNKSKLTLALGKNIFGAPVTVDLAKMPHLLVAGATGAGKSVSINAMICSLLLKSSPEDVRLIMVDPKYLELSGYNGIPHLMLPVVTDPAKANTALHWAVREMERRYQLLADMRVRDIRTYNRKVDKLRGEADQADEPETQETIAEAEPSKILVVRKNADGSEEPIGVRTAAEDEGADDTPVVDVECDNDGPAPRKPRHNGPPARRLPYIVVVIDEFADLMMVASKDVETSVARLAQKARAAGIHVILATQRPSVDVITGLIKANFPSRISFQVASMHDSKTILGTLGAENLLGSGDMLVLDRGAEMKRIHGAYISDEEIQRIIEWLKEQGRPVYDMDILQPKDEDEPEQSHDVDHDEMYDQAVALVAESRQASISMIQRRLRVGYNRAARMVERMEKEGVVGPADGVKGREVLINPI